MLVALIASIEGMLVCAARSKQGRARRQQLLMGTGTDLHRSVPFVDNYFQQKAVGATKFQRFIAGRLAAFIRRFVRARSFEYLLLHLIRTAINRRRNRILRLKRKVTL